MAQYFAFNCKIMNYDVYLNSHGSTARLQTPSPQRVQGVNFVKFVDRLLEKCSKTSSKCFIFKKFHLQ
jgi:hypothetical protein